MLILAVAFAVHKQLWNRNVKTSEYMCHGRIPEIQILDNFNI